MGYYYCTRFEKRENVVIKGRALESTSGGHDPDLQEPSRESPQANHAVQKKEDKKGKIIMAPQKAKRTLHESSKRESNVESSFFHRFRIVLPFFFILTSRHL